jgi:diadenosine tetraphosphate (Ap4A) HIT family hydrolase
MEDWKKDRIGFALRGENPTVLARMKSGFVVIGDPQFLPGYCILLAYPIVNSLNNLSMEQRKDFLLDMSLLGDAISDVCSPIRINYDILGNTDAFLHAHVFPRYKWEEEARRKYPAWQYPGEYWSMEEYQFCEEKHGDLKARLSKRLQQLIGWGEEINAHIQK